MKPRNRSLTGAMIAVFVLPVFAGLLACLPVPIGDPEKSRIDPELSGMWVSIWDDQFVSLFEPYDRRTWLQTMFEVNSGKEDCEWQDDTDDVDNNDIDAIDWTYDMVIREMGPLESGCLESDSLVLFKVWRKKLGGQWFMIWEPKGVFDYEDEFDTEEWLVFRIDKRDPGKLFLWVVNEGYDGFDDVDETRKAYERVIKKNVDDPELYAEEPWIFWRVQADDRSNFIAIMDDVVNF